MSAHRGQRSAAHEDSSGFHSHRRVNEDAETTRVGSRDEQSLAPLPREQAMQGNAQRTERVDARLRGSAVLEVRILTRSGTVRLGDVTYQDWLTKRALDAA